MVYAMFKYYQSIRSYKTTRLVYKLSAFTTRACPAFDWPSVHSDNCAINKPWDCFTENDKCRLYCDQLAIGREKLCKLCHEIGQHKIPIMLPTSEFVHITTTVRRQTRHQTNELCALCSIPCSSDWIVLSFMNDYMRKCMRFHHNKSMRNILQLSTSAYVHCVR